MPSKVLHTCVQFTLGRSHAVLFYPESMSLRFVVVSVLGTESRGLGSPREPESLQSSEPQQMKDRCDSI